MFSAVSIFHICDEIESPRVFKVEAKFLPFTYTLEMKP